MSEAPNGGSLCPAEGIQSTITKNHRLNSVVGESHEAPTAKAIGIEVVEHDKSLNLIRIVELRSWTLCVLN